NVFNPPLPPSRIFEKILIATEGTPIMSNCMGYIANLFPESEFHVVSVVDTSVGSVHLTRALVKILEERAERALIKSKNIFKEYGIKIKTRALRGDPARAITSYARREDVDLVVLGASTKSGVVKFTFGHVGENLIKNLKHPILVINQTIEIKKPMKILSPTDGGVHSKEAGKVALFLAQYFKGTLYKYYIGEDAQVGKKVLDAAEAWAKQVGVKEVNKLDLTEHDPAEEILRIAPDFDVIVIGKGKKSLLKKDILGLTSREVAALSPVAVFLVGK
ncbi:MAG: universal stress protein, partial [Thermoplasmata archaeon]|nr:universal stress protein [Thermoplasmata archaeon]